ncbi:CpsD/CapB family tyrosine-protein kinase [Salipiger mangrovisoli]|uniref:CpsD/CapB family tyrosine-protein kinase n=1 Tax=Salipiger mangrovisoli TaxID=2865933 RepID=A0ABR9XAD2_9RHOB|nr:CpsD/CapB family tyrosine-protein kinase [Salipiger mangrovisoli]MBE9640439.1 CpsD/CapB family tyrosine-protein kinase [Salipiger mangrovisoli]
MERLQAAINKARRHQQVARSAPQPAAGGQVETAWRTLPELRLDSRSLKRNRIVTLHATPEATPFDMLRTRTLRTMLDNGWRRLAITSPTPSCGKSTVALNLALSIARQSATRTVEIEMDMRRPSQDALLGQRPGREAGGQSVEKLLTGELAFAEAGRRVGQGLALATSSTPVRNASDILLGESVARALQAIETTYQPQIMLFDMPPVFSTDDTMAFMRHVDCVLIVAAAERSTIAEIDRCERELASQTNVLGVVLNKCRLSEGGQSGDGYGYGYGPD